MNALKTTAAVAGFFVVGYAAAAGALLAVFLMALRAEDWLQERNAEAAKRVEL